MSQAKALQQEVDLLQGSPYLHGLRRIAELKSLSLAILKSLQSQLRSDLEEIEKVRRLFYIKRNCSQSKVFASLSSNYCWLPCYCAEKSTFRYSILIHGTVTYVSTSAARACSTFLQSNHRSCTAARSISLQYLWKKPAMFFWLVLCRKASTMYPTCPTSR